MAFQSYLSHRFRISGPIERGSRKLYEIFGIRSLAHWRAFFFSPTKYTHVTNPFHSSFVTCLRVDERGESAGQKMKNSVSISHATELICRYHVIGAQGALCRRRTTLIRN